MWTVGAIDTWPDWIRVFNTFTGVLCFIWLMGGLIRQHNQWNSKTRDFWYSRLLWAATQIVISIDGINLGAGFSYGLGFITVAGVITFKGLNRRGKWGYDPAKA